MTIEDAFRAEKSYETRSENTDLVIGTTGYGQFPYDLTVTSNSVFSPESDMGDLKEKRIGDYVSAAILRSRGPNIVEYLLDVYN